MSFSLFNKLMLTALLAFGLTYQPEVKASHLEPEQVLCSSLLIGAAHGLFNKIHERAIKAHPEKYAGFYFFTYILARAFQRGLLGATYSDTKDFLSLFGHGLGQSLVESYDPGTQSFSGLNMNLTLLESAIAGARII